MLKWNRLRELQSVKKTQSAHFNLRIVTKFLSHFISPNSTYPRGDTYFLVKETQKICPKVYWQNTPDLVALHQGSFHNWRINSLQPATCVTRLRTTSLGNDKRRHDSPMQDDRLLERSMMARLLGLFSSERFAREISAVTRVMVIL